VATVKLDFDRRLSLGRDPSKRNIPRDLDGQQIFVDGTSHLHRSFIHHSLLNFAVDSSATNAMKASVPKLFSCPGSAVALPCRSGWRCGLATACETYNTVGSLPFGLVSTSKHYKLSLFMLESCASGLSRDDLKAPIFCTQALSTSQSKLHESSQQ
jgi:hypothetical protein